MPRILASGSKEVETIRKLELNAPLELEGARIVAGTGYLAKGGIVYVDADLIVLEVVAEGDVVGYVIAIHAEDELVAVGNVEGAVDGHGQTEVALRAKSKRRNAVGVSDGVDLRVTEGADTGGARNWRAGCAGIAGRSLSSSGFADVAQDVRQLAKIRRRRSMSPPAVHAGRAVEVGVKVRHDLALSKVLCW